MQSKLLLLILLIPLGFALPHLFSQDTNDEESGPRRLLHHHSSSSGGILAESHGALTTTAKVVACKSIEKGVCMGVAAVKYSANKMTESKSIESKNTESNIPKKCDYIYVQ